MTSRPVRTAQLSADQQAAVLALVAAAEETDGVPPLSEQSRLAVRGRSGHAVEHLLAYADTHLAGYLQADEESAELVVAPAHRRSGVGSQLLDQVPAGTRVWAHGDLAAAERFAAARGLEVVRELFVWGGGSTRPRRWTSRFCPAVSSRPFRPGRDEEEWLRVNAAAFAHHAEQGRMTRADLDARMDEPWFDPAGLICRPRIRPRHGGRVPLDEGPP